jgi:hypothetical protein
LSGEYTLLGNVERWRKVEADIGENYFSVQQLEEDWLVFGLKILVLEFPCSLIDEFPLPVGKKVILRAVPYWRTHGTEQWILAEEKRYRCLECGQKLFRGDKQCHQCKCPVNVD